MIRKSTPKQLECVFANCRAWSRVIGQRRELIFAPSGGIVGGEATARRMPSARKTAFPGEADIRSSSTSIVGSKAEVARLQTELSIVVLGERAYRRCLPSK